MTVTLALLFPHLDDLIQTPADVQRLNEAILQLAVQGKLVPQDPRDEPAGALLKRIAVEKERLVEEGEIDKEKPLPPIAEDEMPFALPLGWEWARLADAILAVQTGPFGSTLHKADYVENGIPVVNPANIQDDYIRILPDMMIGRDTLKRLERYILEEGDIVMARRGEMGRCALVTAREAGWLCGSGSFTLQTSPEIFRPFLINVIRSPKSRAYLAGGSVGATMSNLNHRILNNLVIGIPPLAEQKRIVAKVDELFAQTRALEAKLRRAQEAIVVVNRAVLHHLHHAADNATFQHATQILGDHFDLLYTDPRPVTDLRQTILQLAVQGKLVPQDPHDEPAGALLKRIEKESKETQPISTIAEEEQPYALPESWEWVRFGTICEHRLGKMLDNQKNKGDYRPYLRNLNVQWDRIDFDDIQVMRFEPQEFDEYRLLPGDLLICEGGEPGRCAIWHHAETEMMFQKAIHRARPYCGITPRYLLFHLRADADGGRLANYFTGATIQHFTGRALANYCIALPPLAEQKRIVAKVDELLARCAALERKLGQAQGAGRQLTAAVLQGVVG